MNKSELLKLAAARIVVEKTAMLPLATLLPLIATGLFAGQQFINPIVQANNANLEKTDPLYRLNRLDAFGRMLSHFPSDSPLGENFASNFANANMDAIAQGPNFWQRNFGWTGLT